MNKIKRIIKILPIFTLIIFLMMQNHIVFADEETTEPTIYSNSCILVDNATGQILFEHDAEEQVYPASTTKLMTAILVMENCNLDDKVTVTKEAISSVPYSYATSNISAGETFTVEELLNVMLIPSANDIANALAIHVAGSIDSFAEMMNTRAAELGAKNTHFVNPSGIHNENHYTTAYDLSLIGRHASTFEKLREICKKTEYEILPAKDGSERKYETTNHLIDSESKYFYEYATGLKTGYTDAAKNCIIASAKKDDMDLICVILGGGKSEKNESYREIDCHTLFDYGFNNFEYKTVCKKDNLVDASELGELPEVLKDAQIAYGDTIERYINKNNTIAKEVKWNDELKRPIQKGSKLGTITYNIDGENFTIDLIAYENIESPFSAILNSSLLPIAIMVLIVAVVSYNKKKRNTKRRI